MRGPELRAATGSIALLFARSKQKKESQSQGPFLPRHAEEEEREKGILGHFAVEVGMLSTAAAAANRYFACCRHNAASSSGPGGKQ